MKTTRIAALLRALAQPVLIGLLALVLLVSGLAAHSSCLHEWLHADHQSPAHHCLVTVLEQGHTEVATVTVPVVSADLGVPVAALPGESFFITHDIALHPERGPPVQS